jgi:hypothetical protein
MKAKILKIAGVKSEKEFYKKYPSEEAFMKVHGKAFKKAQMGAYIGGDTIAAPKMVNFNSMYDDADLEATGMTDAMRKAQAEKAAEAAAAKQSGEGAGGGDAGGMGGMDMDSIMSMFGGGEGGDAGGIAEIASMAGGRDGLHIPKAAGGTNVNNWWASMTTDTTTTAAPVFDIKKWGIGAQTMGKLGNTPAPSNKTVGTPVDTSKENWMFKDNTTIPQVGAPSTQGLSGGPIGEGPDNNLSSKLGTFGKMLGPIGGIISGIDALKAEQEAARRAQQAKELSGLQLKASTTRPEQRERKYVRPEDVVNTGEAFFPIYGVGTNVLAKDGKFIKKAQDGTVEIPEIDPTPTNWYEEGMDKDTYYGLKKQLDDAGYESIEKPEEVNIKEMQEITEYQPDPNQMSDEDAAAFMERYNRDQGKSTETFDSNSARDTWVHKTGLPWSDAKRLGYTDGSARDNTKLLSELKDPRFNKENLRTSPPKKSSQARTPVQHRDTPTGKLAPIKKAMTLEDFYKSKGYDMSKRPKGPEFKQDTRGSYQRELDAKRSQAEYDDYLLGELPLYYLANPSKLVGDIKNWLNPSFTTESETSEPFRKQVMANRYNKSISDKERSARHRQMGYGLVPDATLNAASVLTASPYTTFEAMPIGIGQGAGPRVAGYVTQGAKRLGQAAPKMLGYRDGGMIGGNPTEIQNTYGDGNSIYDDLGYTPLIDENQQKSFRQGGYIPRMQEGGETGWQRWQNSMAGKGKGFSGSTANGEGGGTDWGAISNVASGLGQEAMGGQNAGGSIGGTIGGSIGSIFGPAGGAIGGFVGTLAGNYLDPYQRRMKNDMATTRRNVQNTAMNQMAPAIQAGYASHMKDGGWVSNDWQPQVIASFGDVTSEDYHRFAHKDEFRAGGHLKAYTPPSARAMKTYEDGGDVKSYGLGGELETHWGGYAEPMSYNPYLPGTGETVMFRGKSHEERSPNGETGIGVTYGGNPVEVERGEPMVELEEGGVVDPETGEVQKSGVVFGNLKIPNQYIDLLGDKSAKGKKFKNYVADLSKMEEKQNKMIAKSTEELNALDINSSFDRLKLSSLQANIKGGNLKLKEIADKKISAAGLQNAINDTAEEYGLVADDLARGKVKEDKEAMKEYAKFGKSIPKAQGGKKIQFTSKKAALDAGYVEGADGKYYKIIPPEKSEPIETKVAEAQKEIPLQHKDAYGLYGGASAKLAQAQRNNPWFDWAGFNPSNSADVKRFQSAFNQRAKSIGSTAELKVDGLFGDQTASALIDEKRKVQPSVGTREEAEILEAPTTPIPYKRSPWIDFGNQVLDYIRPTDQEELDYDQLMGEMYALSTNQLDPVQAQLYKPEIGVPYDISYQDQLNENQADYNAAQRIMGYNPAALANLNAQKYQANSKVLAEQFRANQAMKDKVYGENRNILNQAKLANLGILDKQYERQSEAMSNTKATTQAALNSISDKYAKNRLENRTLGIYENLYKYRYDDKGRAINMNGLFQPNIPTVGSTSATQKQVPVYEADGKTIKYYKLEQMTPEEIAAQEQNNTGAIPSLATLPINGNTKTKSKKESRNGSIVKSIKNL